MLENNYFRAALESPLRRGRGLGAGGMEQSVIADRSVSPGDRNGHHRWLPPPARRVGAWAARAGNFCCGGRAGRSDFDGCIRNIRINQRAVFPHTEHTRFIPELVAGGRIRCHIIEDNVEARGGSIGRCIQTDTGQLHGNGADTESQDVVRIGSALFDGAFQSTGSTESLCCQ